MQSTQPTRQVVLVDDHDNQLGLEDITIAHQNPGKLHRAISIMLFQNSSQGKLFLIQQRSQSKPLWPLCWSNTVCTHPQDGESYLDCAVRRLKEELDISLDQDSLKIIYRYKYQADYNKSLSEHELDTVMISEYQGDVRPNPDEVNATRWMSFEQLHQEISNQPETYTHWVKQIVVDNRFISALSLVTDH